MKLTPASMAASMMATPSSWSRLPKAPNIMAPRQSVLTLTPVCPSVRYCMAAPSRRADLSQAVPAQPTEPSICSSISRLHSTAYSIGSVRVTGSMKPLTIMLIACCSERPRLMR